MDESSGSSLSEPASPLLEPASLVPASPAPASLPSQLASPAPAGLLSQLASPVPASLPSHLASPLLQPEKQFRRREVDSTYYERIQLFSYTKEHPKATQKDLVKWFNTTFNKSINQSTVSRRLNINKYI